MNKEQKIVATIEARMTSSKIPGKVLLPLPEKPALQFLIGRLRLVPSIDEIVIATTVNQSDDPIIDFARQENIPFFRGSEDDVMQRVIDAAESRKADIIVEITGDCPIIDPDIVEQCIRMHLGNSSRYSGNAHIRSYPDGMDVQVFSLADLKKSSSMTDNPLDREHVSLHMRNHPGIFTHLHLIAPPSLHWPELGLTLDESADYDLLKNIVAHFAKLGRTDFSCGEVICYLRENPRLVELNRGVVRKGDT